MLILDFNLTGPQEPKDLVKIITVFMRVCQEEMSTGLGRLSKAGGPSQWRPAPSIPLRPEENAEAEKGGACSLCWTAELNIRLVLLWNRIYIMSSPGSQAFGSDWIHATGFPGSPACRWQIVKGLSLHN